MTNSFLTLLKQVPGESPELVDLENIGSAAAQRVNGLLGQILRRRVEEVQLTGAQSVAGVVVTVCG